MPGILQNILIILLNGNNKFYEYYGLLYFRDGNERGGLGFSLGQMSGSFHW